MNIDLQGEVTAFVKLANIGKIFTLDILPAMKVSLNKHASFYLTNSNKVDTESIKTTDE